MRTEKTTCHSGHHHCVTCHDSKESEHEEDHSCNNTSCAIAEPHGHINPKHDHDSCLGCMRDHLRKIFPLEEKIKELKVGKTIRQLLTMVSNLTPAISISEITSSLHINSFISSPLAISSMHLTNRGINQLPKLLLTVLSSVGVIAAQRFADLSRLLTRPIMALAVFFIERNGTHKEKSDSEIKKSDWVNLLKLQGQINTVPWLVNLYTSRLKELNKQNDNFVNRFLSNVGISSLHIAGLSLGFVGLGHLIDKSLVKFKLVSNEESIAMRAEGAVCACCGAPVCIAEAASEAAAMSVAA